MRFGKLRAFVLCSVALLLLPADDATAQESGAWKTRLRATLPLAKRHFLTEPLRTRPGEQCRVVLRGTFHFTHNDRTYDALYTTDTQGRFARPHDYVVFSPQELRVVEQDVEQHRYVFEVPAALARSGQSIGVGLDLPQMVRDFLLTPSEVVDQLSGDMQIQLQQRAAVPVAGIAGSATSHAGTTSASTAPYWLAALLLAACAGVIWYCRRTAGLSQQLHRQLQRIRTRHAEVQSLLRGDADRFDRVAEHVSRLKDGAETLARAMQRFVRLQDGLDTDSLEREIGELEQQQQAAQREDLQQEIGSTLVEKRRLHDVLGDTRTRQARYALRLSKIEAVLESTRLSIPKLAALEEDLVAQHGSHRQQDVLEQIQFELRAVEEALVELEQP
jgi:hypothetical protein